MSDDLAEAVERLKAVDALPNDNYPVSLVYGGTECEAGDRYLRDLCDLAHAYLSTLTAPTPVTVEGLKGLGFKKCSHRDFKCAMSHPSGLIWDGRKKHVSARMWMTIKRPDPDDNYLDYATPQPETIEDVQYLLTRLSRPKPQ